MPNHSYVTTICCIRGVSKNPHSRIKIIVLANFDHRVPDVPGIVPLLLVDIEVAHDHNIRHEAIRHLVQAFPMAPEGDLSRLRASLVKDTSLAALAADLGLGEHLILGSGERKTGGHRRESILADALEAIFGAVYLDAGFDAAAKVIASTFGDRLQNFPTIESLRDPKTRLQEWLQARQTGLPEYDLVGVTGKAHKQTFEVSCSVTTISSSTRGFGTTRRNAEQESAEKMLLKLAEDKNS